MSSTIIASTSRLILLQSPKLKLFSTTSIKLAIIEPTTLSQTRASLPAQFQSEDSLNPSLSPSSSSTRTPTRMNKSNNSTTNYSSSSTFTNYSRFRAHAYKLNVYTTRNNTILTLSTTPSASTSNSSSSSSSRSEQDLLLLKKAPHVPVSWVSAGSAGYKGAARGTFDAGVECAIKMFAKIDEMVNPTMGLGGNMKKKSEWPVPTELEVVWKGFGQGRDAVFRTLMGGEGDKVRGLVNRVTDATPFKIGGTRSRKRRVI